MSYVGGTYLSVLMRLANMQFLLASASLLYRCDDPEMKKEIKCILPLHSGKNNQ
jgi:hypothetical protein